MSWTDVVGVNDVDVNDVGVKGWTGVGVKGCAMRRSRELPNWFVSSFLQEV